MAKINGGATLWARQTTDSDIFYNKPDKWFKIWFYLVNKVNHADNKQFKRGTCFMKYEWIMGATGATYHQIKHCLEYLKSATQIATQKKTRGLLVTVINYDFYQTLDNYYYAESHTEGRQKGKQKEDRRKTRINKNDKNDKNVIKDKGDIFLKAWKDFKEMRKKIKKPMTERAEEMLSSSLNKLSNNKIEQIAILNQSIFHCWQGVFPLKDKPASDEAQPRYIPKELSDEEIEKNKKNITESKKNFLGIIKDEGSKEVMPIKELKKKK